MDVRCDRCQTEYELDDESVAGAGASVQCTTCGHTFVVSRNGSISVGLTPPSGLGNAETTSTGPRPSQPSLPSAGPAVPEWVLATEEGQTHRLRDLTTLQKWVVERRVSRGDRVSHRGGAWRTLGDVEELRPFFDVVDQADRQTGAARGAEPSTPAMDPDRAGRATSPATPRRLQNAIRPHVSADLDDDDVLSGASSRGRRGRGGTDSFLDANIGDDDDDLSLAFKPRRTGLKIVGGLVFVGLAAGAAWFMFRDPHAFHLASGTPLPPAGAAPGNGSSSAAAPAPVAPAPAAPVPVASAPAAPAAAAAAPGDPTAAAVPAAPPAPPVKPAAAPPPPPAAALAPAAPAPHVAASPPPEATKARSYEQLVADADRALENGQTAKAQKLYEDALRLQPNGVAAMTGSAYVLLDKRHPLAAIGLFKQALSNAPHFAPALFGLGEAYRGEGEAAQAIDAYKRYLEQSPTGTDAPAARRQ
ncbi:MAG TPA: zinc-ribbon domain-containing protein, partial [Polyangia bacterium]|nr:zinc-ribbon domain-containing protein [Polyangia bacterium]